MKLIDDDGTEIKISKETAKNIREARNPKSRERKFDDVRISVSKDRETGYPIRISILDDTKQGDEMGIFPDSNIGSLPGNTLCVSDACKLANYILELCNELEKK